MSLEMADFCGGIPFGPHDAGVSCSIDEFETAEFDLDYRYELIRGVVAVLPIPPAEVRHANEQLGHWLLTYGESHANGSVLDLTLPDHNLRTAQNHRHCERVVWAGLGRMPRTRGPVERRDAPTIVVDFPASRPADQRRDYVERQIEYRHLGVLEYWIVDRFRRTMTVYLWQNALWDRMTVREQDVHTTPVLPGFQLPLGRLLAVSDKYRD